MFIFRPLKPVDMSTNFDTYVIGLFANNQSRNAAARLGNPDNPASWTWYNIESTHFDCVTNMLEVLASAHPTNGYVNVILDDKGKIIDVTAWVKGITQEESKRLMNEGSKNSITSGYIFANVIGIVANNQSRTAYAWLREKDKPTNTYLCNIEPTHFDCVTNMLGVLAHAKSAATTVEVRLDGENKIIDVIAADGNMTQEESKRLMNEGSTNSP